MLIGRSVYQPDFGRPTFILGVASWAFFDFGNAKKLAREHDKDLMVVETVLKNSGLMIDSA